MDGLKDLIDFVFLLLGTAWIFLAVRLDMRPFWIMGIALALIFPVRVLFLWFAHP